jgi:Arc/MetJ family transcription regulator
VRVIQIELDDETLAEAMRLAGTRTEPEAVELAVRDYVARHRRADELGTLARNTRGWDHDGWKRPRAAGQNAPQQD